MGEQAREWMKKVDKSGLPGRFKAWCYQHGVLPRLLWPLLVYAVPLSAVEAVERMISQYLRRWLGVPRSFTSIGLYGTGSMLQVPLRSVTEEYKVTKARQVMMLRDSTDEKVSRAGIEVRTGRKWRAAEEVAEAEERLKHSDIVGTVTSGRLGLGCLTRSMWKSARAEERRKMVQKEIRQNEEEGRQARAVAMKKQGSWVNWEGARPRKLGWRDMWQMEGHRISFLLRSVYDVLPSPTNLCTWGLTTDPSCKLCGRPANLEHVLSSCRQALEDGRYSWRHDKVLAAIAHRLEQSRKKKRDVKGLRFIPFVKAGEKKQPLKERGGLLATARDWELRVDIKQQLKFPPEIAVTSKRPDMVLWSGATRQVAIIELTVPWEERMEEAYERKRAKYQELVEDCQERGWKAWCLPVEVGCRGFAGQSLWRALRVLGVVGLTRRQIITEATREAETASRWLWQKREEQWKR